ncbi:hypothetical protein PAAG_00446 [Paracoccidioides lutzii Pb01]|uniref:Uncharacterized protein n=1 Tax=Paracoccidioides lutzii (strain ATCC MYA-826 / Pb01) TaxID=502779 RepID=C1GPK1_PARBA|nr:hypothetical protein PAAG_00446 [Paracoccidioides lutzii Pb01]EEH36123.1 hypothetical protein PAAG_00446 [Paracoccidioides lutzii Pb01]
MAEKDSTTKHNPVPIHKKPEEQVSTAEATSSAQIEQVEHGLAEKAAQKVLRENQRADSDPQGRSPTGTNESPVKGLSNEDLWMLIRWFNDQVHNVKAVPAPPPGDFDLYRTKEEGFSPDTLRSAIERFYAMVVIGSLTFPNVLFDCVRGKRLGEQQRSVYFAAWVLDLIIPTALSTLLVSETGGAQQPKVGVVGSKGTVTGAPEKFKGASRLALECAGGKYDDEAQADDENETSSLGDPANIASKTADAATASRGGMPSEEHDKTKEHMMEIIREKAIQITVLIDGFSDVYERLSKYAIVRTISSQQGECFADILTGSALSPKPPFISSWPRIRIALLLSFATAVILLTPSYIFIKTGTFLAGFGFFGDPIIGKATGLLDRKPRNPTQAKGEGGNLIFRGVPTNAQLTLTIFRIGEACGYPVPAPPVSLKSKTSESVSTAEEELPQEFLDADINPESPENSSETGEKSPAKAEPEKKTWEEPLRPELKRSLLMITLKPLLGQWLLSSILEYFARNANLHSRPHPRHLEQARYKGQKGAIIIASPPSTQPLMLYFTTEPGQQSKDFNIEEGKKKGTILFSISINEIQVLKKISVMGWTEKLLVGWSEPNKEVVDGLAISGKNAEQQYQVTAIGRRDSLFNRLISMNGTFWDIY